MVIIQSLSLSWGKISQLSAWAVLVQSGLDKTVH